MINRSILNLVLPVCLFGASCHLNSTYNNRETDKQDGEKLIVQFYELIKNKNYQATYKLYDKRFFAVTDTQKLNDIYSISFEKLGSVKSYNLEHWETEAIVGSDSKTNYLFSFNVTRSNFNSKEIFALTKEKEGIKITSYHVNSDGFFKK